MRDYVGIYSLGVFCFPFRTFRRGSVRSIFANVNPHKETLRTIFFATDAD